MRVVTPSSRLRFITDRLDEAGVCTYDELASALGVSSMTIRRDVESLARQGKLIKTLGGVQKAAAPELYESDLRSRLGEHRAEKHAIARAALDLVAGRRTLFLDGGTTCLEFAKLLATQRTGLTVVTNSALACIELGRGRENMTVAIGGQYDAPSASFVGPSAEESASKFFVDVAFVSTKGLIPDTGTFESSIATFHIKQIVARQAGTVVLLIDHSKFNRRALSKVLDIAQVHVVVTDDGACESDLSSLRRRVRQVIVAPPGAGALKRRAPRTQSQNAT